jgi:hypothetical protein
MTDASRSPLLPLQVALYEQLATLGVGVFDHVPEDTEQPYIRLGEHLSIPDNAHGQFGRNVTVTLHVWTRARGNASGQTIADQVIALLDHQPLTVDGHDVISVRHEFDQALTDPDPEIRHHVLRFRVVTSQQPS